MYCKNCGASLSPNVNYCSNCGHSTKENPVQPSDSQKLTTNKSPLWFKALLCLVAIILGGSILMALISEDLTDTVKDQLKAIRKGQITEAYYDFTSKKFQESTPLELFREFINKYPAFSQNQSVQFNDRNVNNHIGTLETILTTSNNDKIPVEYKLIKENDKWKVLSIRLEDLSSYRIQAKSSTGIQDPIDLKVEQQK